MIRRPRRTIPASLTALALLALCVFVALSCIQLLLGKQPLIPYASLATYGQQLSWQAPVVLIAGIVAAVLGLILLGCALWPGKPTVLPLAAADDGSSDSSDRHEAWHPLDAGVTRRGLRAALRATLTDAAGVSKARIRIRRRRIRGTGRTERWDTTTVHAQADEALRQRLGTLALRRTPRVRMRVKYKRSHA